jgi:hypothetical protein
MAKTYEPIATYTATGSVSSYTFTSIPSTYTDLILVCDFAYASLGANTGYPLIRVGNGSVDSGSNYSFTYIKGDGSTASSGRASNNTYLNSVATVTGSDRYAAVFNFQNYSNTTTNKSVIHRIGSATKETFACASLWRSTSAINTLQFYDFSGYNFSSDSTFTLYGILKA